MLNPPQPLVSIVIPVYNQRLDFFKEAVDSALSQTYSNIEVLVSDNHSMNGLAEYLNSIQDHRLRVVKPPEFLPMVQSFQYAGNQASGDWISYLGSDDWIYPDCIETLVSAVGDRQGVALVYSDVESVPYSDMTAIEFYFNRMPTAFFSAQESFNNILAIRRPSAWLQGNMIARKAYLAAREVLSGYIKHSFDVSLFLKVHEFGDVVYVDKPTTKFRMWTAAEGKVDVDGIRLYNAIHDLKQNYRLITGSPRLMSYTDTANVAGWLAFQVRNLELYALIGFISGSIRPVDCKKGLVMLNTEFSSATYMSGIIDWLVSHPQSRLTKPVLGGLHTLYVQLRNTLKRPL